MQKGGTVGASEFLRPQYSELFEVDYEKELVLIVDQIESLLENDDRLNDVGKRASQRARQYNAVQNAQQLQQILAHVVQRQPRQQFSV